MDKLCVYGIVLFIHMVINVSICDKYEKALLAHLFNKSRDDAHNPLERPVSDHTKPLEVRVRFDLAQIMDVDERNQILKTNIWLDMKWFDYHFVWNSEKFGNITNINLIPEGIWTPDIILYNKATEQFAKTFSANIVNYYNGHMHSEPPGIYSSTCTIDITYFPFDRQRCFLKFGSWSYDGNGIKLQLQCPGETHHNTTPSCIAALGEAGLKSYVKNGEWVLLSTIVNQFIKRYDCCDVDFYDIKLCIDIQRRSFYYIFNLILPCVLISIISLLMFALPPDSGEKISLGVTILLSLVMFLLLVANSLPQTSIAIPLISIYFSTIMIISSFSLICTVFVLNCHHGSTNAHQIPRFILIVVNKWLAKCLFMKPPAVVLYGHETRWSKYPNNRVQTIRRVSEVQCETEEMKKLTSLRNSDLSQISNLAESIRRQFPLENDFCKTCGQITLLNKDHNSTEAIKISSADALPSTSSASLSLLDSILRELQSITRKMSDDEAANIIGQHWKFTARVIDRFCLIFFTVFTLICTLAVLKSTKYESNGLIIPAEDRIN